VQKPFSQACENNKGPILSQLERFLPADCELLEVGSGTGQHAVFFAGRLPRVVWQTSDLPERHADIRQWIGTAALANLREPLALDVRNTPWPVRRAGAVFSANTAHIMGWPAVAAFVAGVGEILEPGGPFCLYGPFRSGGSFTASSDAQFDLWLKQRDPESGIRNFEDVDALARGAGLESVANVSMPANNRFLVWRKPCRQSP